MGHCVTATDDVQISGCQVKNRKSGFEGASFQMQGNRKHCRGNRQKRKKREIEKETTRHTHMDSDQGNSKTRLFSGELWSCNLPSWERDSRCPNSPVTVSCLLSVSRLVWIRAVPPLWVWQLVIVLLRNLFLDHRAYLPALSVAWVKHIST